MAKIYQIPPDWPLEFAARVMATKPLDSSGDYSSQRHDPMLDADPASV